MNIFYGWDLSTKRSAIVRLTEDGPFVEASWTQGPPTENINLVIDFLKVKLDRIQWEVNDVPLFFVDWTPHEVFAFNKSSKRYLNIKSFVAGWIFNELTSRGAVVSFISPIGVRKGLGINARGGKELVHQELRIKHRILTKKFNEHELDAIALALVGKKVIGTNGNKLKTHSMLI